MVDRDKKEKTAYDDFIKYMQEANAAKAMKENGLNSPNAETMLQIKETARHWASQLDAGFTEDKLKDPNYIAKCLILNEVHKKEKANADFSRNRTEITKNAKNLENLVLVMPEVKGDKKDLYSEVAKAEKEYKSSIEMREKVRAGLVEEDSAKKMVNYAKSYTERKAKELGLGKEATKMAIDLSQESAIKYKSSRIMISYKLAEESRSKYQTALQKIGSKDKDYAIAKVEGMKDDEAMSMVYTSSRIQAGDPESVYLAPIRRAIKKAKEADQINEGGEYGEDEEEFEESPQAA